MSRNEWEILRGLSKRQTPTTTTTIESASPPTPTPYDNSHDKPNPFNSKRTVEALIITFGIVSWICVALRVHTRRRLQALGWDDFFVVVFRITGTIGSIFILLLFDNGLGKHFKEIGPVNQMIFQKKYYVALLAYTVSTALMKICLLSQYLRLFAEDVRARRVCWFFIVLSSMWGLAFSIIALVPCVPIYGFWDWSIKSHCYGFGSRMSSGIAGTYAAHVTTNVALDLIVLAIPIPLYFKTFRQKKQRIGFSIMILLGILINLVSIWRLHGIITTRAATYPVVDPSFYGPQAIVLASLEIDLASIVASIPVFWPVLTQNWGKIFVTQEVHVTRHHRRLSGEDNFELHATPSRSTSALSRSRSRGGSDGSLKLVIQDTDGQSRGGFLTHSHTQSESESRSQSHSRSQSRSRTPQMIGDKKRYDMNDPYIRERIYPLDGGPMITSEAQVVSEGQRGFERNYREHFAGTVDAKSMNVSSRISSGKLSQTGSLDKLDYEAGGAMRASNEERRQRSRDGSGGGGGGGGYGHNRDRSWSISMSRKSSQRFLN